MKIKFKKLNENTFERMDTRQVKTILNEEELIKSRDFLKQKIADFTKQLSYVERNLEGIAKAKKG